MKKFWKQTLSIMTSLFVLLSMNGGFFNPIAAYAEDEQEAYTGAPLEAIPEWNPESETGTDLESIPAPADGPDPYIVAFDGTKAGNTITFTVGSMPVVVSINTNPEGLTVAWDNDRELRMTPTTDLDYLGALNLAVNSITDYNADTMDIYLIGDNNFNCTLDYSGGTLSRSDEGGIPNGCHFEIRAKGGDCGDGGEHGRPGGDSIAHIEAGSSGMTWTGIPCVYEGFYPFIDDTGTVEWNTAQMKSWQFCSVSINGGERRGFNNRDERYTTTPDSSVDVEYFAGEDRNHVDVTFSFGWGYRPADVIRINETEYRVSDYLNFDDRQAWLDAFSFEYRDQDISMTIPNVPVEIEEGVTNISILIDLRPVSATECFIGNFLWSSNPNPDNPDDDQYIGHADLALISATYPEWLGGRTFKEDVLESESRARKDEKTARYITYGVTNGDGEMVLPVGTKVTMRVAPEFGYQVTSFKINGTPIEQDEIDTGSDVAVFTFTIETANFHLGADILQVGNEAVTANTKAVSEAGVELGGGESSMKIGTAKLEIEDFTPSTAQEGLFRTAAGDYDIKDFIDISLFNTVYKGTSSASWDTPVKRLDNKATIYLALEEDVSDKDIMIVHEVAEGEYETIEADYLADYDVVCFETSSFSNYAIAVKDQGPSKDINLAWYTSEGKSYWYENGVRQGTAEDEKAVSYAGTVRGREVYDPVNHSWYWLDANANGAMAKGKEVFVPYIYQKELTWDEEKMMNMASASDPGVETYIYKCMLEKKGKWVRYDGDGKMVRGWYTVEGENRVNLFPKQAGNTYYYDTKTGAMVKGEVFIDGVRYYFNEITGVLED